LKIEAIRREAFGDFIGGSGMEESGKTEMMIGRRREFLKLRFLFLDNLRLRILRCSAIFDEESLDRWKIDDFLKNISKEMDRILRDLGKI